MDVHRAIDIMHNDDHGILEPKVVREICAIVGVKPPSTMQTITCAPEEFKGATLYDKKGKRLPSGETAQGYGTMELSRYLCTMLGLTYSFKFGRGSQCRECCMSLFKHFVKEGVK
jgi:hypothetical protein